MDSGFDGSESSGADWKSTVLKMWVDRGNLTVVDSSG
jgi:hypothetical protein